MLMLAVALRPGYHGFERRFSAISRMARELDARLP